MLDRGSPHRASTDIPLARPLTFSLRSTRRCSVSPVERRDVVSANAKFCQWMAQGCLSRVRQDASVPSAAGRPKVWKHREQAAGPRKDHLGRAGRNSCDRLTLKRRSSALGPGRCQPQAHWAQVPEPPDVGRTAPIAASSWPGRWRGPRSPSRWWRVPMVDGAAVFWGRAASGPRLAVVPFVWVVERTLRGWVASVG
jgi:hypothetical protein